MSLLARYSKAAPVIRGAEVRPPVPAVTSAPSVPLMPEWIRRAKEKRLPGKVYQ